MREMDHRPFTSTACDDLGLACEIESDADSVGASATLERYLPAITDPASMPNALDAAIEGALRGACLREGVSPLDAAQALIERHQAHADAILAVALGFGLPECGDEALAVGGLVAGRWRVIELLGEGGTALVARAKDELLSGQRGDVEVVVKRFTDEAGGDARTHAIREMQALVKAPDGLAPRLVALHAPRGGAAHIVTLFEPSREARVPEDLAELVHAVRRLHRAGLVHGDLKPEHLRVRPDGSVLLLDFGASIPATPDALARDFARLLELAAAAHGGGGQPRWLSLARMALARRRLLIAATALRSASPRWRRRVLSRGAIALLLCAALPLAWGNRQRSARPSDAFTALASTGRLVDVTIDSTGRLIGVRLELPELTELHADSPRRAVATGPVRLHREGGVTIFDPAGNPMSR